MTTTVYTTEAFRKKGETSETYAPMDVSSLLDNEETIAEYLTAAAEDENPDVLLVALAEVAKARGMAQVARDAGLGRESLYKALAPGSHPRYETIAAVLRALNVRIAVQAPAPSPSAEYVRLELKGDGTAEYVPAPQRARKPHATVPAKKPRG